jgi:hypothetical protein
VARIRAQPQKCGRATRREILATHPLYATERYFMQRSNNCHNRTKALLAHRTSGSGARGFGLQKREACVLTTRRTTGLRVLLPSLSLLAHTPCRSPKHISVEGVALTALLVRSRAQMADASFVAAMTPRPPNCIARSRAVPQARPNGVSVRFPYNAHGDDSRPHTLCLFWRRERDSNPRRAFDPYTLSRGAPSTTRPSLRGERNLAASGPGAPFAGQQSYSNAHGRGKARAAGAFR